MPHVPEPPVCDFCSSPSIAWDYPTRSFQIAGMQWASDGDWAACTDCAELIERGDRAGLVMHCITTFHSQGKLLDMGAAVIADCTDQLAIMHALFFRHRIGERVPAGPLATTS